MHLVLDNFIDEYCSIIVDRYSRKDDFASMCSDVKKDKLEYSGSVKMWPQDVLNDCCTSYYTNKFILDSIKRQNPSNNWVASLKLETNNLNLSKKLKSIARSKVNMLANKIVSASAPKVLFCNMQCSMQKSLELSTISRGEVLPLWVTRPIISSVETDLNVREKLLNYTCSNELVQATINTLSLNMPACFLEAFDSIRVSIKKQMGHINPSQKVIFGGLRSPSYRICLAECTKAGAEVLGLQTGGLLGEGFYKIEERMRRVTHRFITWGWQRESSDIPLPSIHLADTVQSASVQFANGSKSTESILWISREPSAIEPQKRFGYGIPSSPRIERHEYRENQKRLYANLDTDLKSKVIFRPKPVMLTNEFIEKMQVRFESAEIDDSNVAFMDRVVSAKLVVIDYFGATPFLELLAINKPVLLVSDLPTLHNDLYGISSIARPLYAQLSNVSIFHCNPVSAAHTINKIYHNVNDWWHNPKRSSAVKNFANTFALTHTDAVKTFATEIKNL